MDRRKNNPVVAQRRRRVWRVSEAAPLGEFVYPDEPQPRKEAANERSLDVGWRLSSFELSHGLEVSETPAETVPGELFDALFPKP